MNTLFQHKRRLYTWASPDGQYQNQIDYILCSQRWRSIQSAKQDWERTMAQIMSFLFQNKNFTIKIFCSLVFYECKCKYTKEYICIYVCIYIYIYIHPFVCVYIYIHSFVYIYMHTFYKCTCISLVCNYRRSYC